MTCDVPRLECLHLHIRQRLPGEAKPNDTRTAYRTLCPAHDDREPSLSISVGEQQRIIWNCFAGCDLLRVRAALIDVYRIDRGCLPVSRKDETAMLDRIEDILCSPAKEDTLVRLQALATLRGYRELPRGAELLRLAADIGIGRSQAFDCARRLRASTANAVHYDPRQAGSSTPRSVRRVAPDQKSGNPDSVRKPGPPKSGNPDSGKRVA